MGDVRRTGLTDEELEKLAERLIDKIESRNTCGLTHEQQTAVIDLLSQKKTVVNATLYLVGALILWVLKDVYFYIVTHITWGRG